MLKTKYKKAMAILDLEIEEARYQYKKYGREMKEAIETKDHFMLERAGVLQNCCFSELLTLVELKKRFLREIGE